MTTITKIHARNPHDDGYDLVTGRDIASGQVIGTLFWNTDSYNTGWVLRFDHSEEDFLPDTTGEIAALLAEHGYEMDPDSRMEIERFDENRRGDVWGDV